MRVLVSGASGMVGRYVSRALREHGITVRALLRSEGAVEGPWHEAATAVDLPAEASVLASAVDGCDVVIHLAGRAHVLRETEADPLGAFRRVNLEGTRSLLQAAAGRARRFVLVSTIGVLGGETGEGEAFDERSPLRPHTPYAVSKVEAEDVVRQGAAAHGIETVVIRPPLIYGAYVRGNFERLMKLVRRGVPLPFGAVNNRRSLMGARNLAELLVACATHPAAAGQTLVAADEDVHSIAGIVRHMADALGRPARVVPVPPVLLQAGAAVAGMRGTMSQLTGSLVVDAKRARSLLGWLPRHPVATGMREAAQWMMRGAAP